MTSRIEGLDQPPITLAPGNGRAESSLHRLKIGAQPFYILKQRGRFPDIAYDHGRLLASEIDVSSFPEIVSAIARGIDRENETLERIGAVVYRAYSSRVLKNTSLEFQQAIDAVAAGYFAGTKKAQFSLDDVRDAIVAIEVSNLIEGLSRLIEIPFVRVRALTGLLALCLPYMFDSRVVGTLNRLRRHEGVGPSLSRALANMSSPRTRCGFACTAFCASGQFTADGQHIHARNFDADLYQWNVAPVLALVDETAGRSGWHKYVAFGTAGLIYPGGISGLNDAGLAVSLHQMSTARYRSGFLFGHGEIAPFVQQRILREAATLDDAADLARGIRHFAAWTIFCSDAKSGQGMRIELNADKVRIERGAEPMPQTNHFLHADLVERQFDHSDGHYTPSFGKWLETHARLALVKAALADAAPARRIDVDWAIELLASSEDSQLKLAAHRNGLSTEPRTWARAFGRVPRKAYGQLTSIARGDAERRPGRDEVWMTNGDRRPASHSTYVGWRVTWEPFGVEPVADRPLRRTTTPAASGRARWEDALARYVEACIAVTRPRHSDDTFMRRDPTAEEHKAALLRAIDELSAAIALAAEDRVIEIPFHHMRARLRHEAGDFAGAKLDWDVLRALWAGQAGGASAPGHQVAPLMHPYEAALVNVLSAATEDLLNGSTAWSGRSERLNAARTLLDTLKRDSFGADGAAHFGIAKWLKLIDQIEKNGAMAIELPDENFITAE